jgi:glycine dehydrogenase subunit 1
LYVPNTAAEQQEMLARIGAKDSAELFASIPAEFRLSRPLDLPPALLEQDLERHLAELAGKNQSAATHACFLGGGCYDHYVPAVVDVISSRPEYYTAYTPYQAEASQGTLQAVFEYQSLVCELTGMAVSNASMYEAATAVAEAALMARATNGRSGHVVVLESVHPEYRQTLATYLHGVDVALTTIPCPQGVADPAAVKAALDGSTVCLVLQHPNFFGNLEPVAELTAAAAGSETPVVQAFDPISLGIMKRPGDYGVDIAVAEGQCLGTPLSYGGPFLGLFACAEKFLRKLPGRIVGETVDRAGKRCFVLTLQTREQHIRRDKATSNICTNQGLLALRASVFLALAGPEGLREMAERCWQHAHYAAKALAAVPGLKVRFPAAAYFKEFVIETPGPADRHLAALADLGFHAGVPLGRWFPALGNCLLVAVTEKRTKAEIDGLAAAWRTVLAS